MTQVDVPMQVDISEILKKYKELMAEMQYELITHRIAVDVLERSSEDLQAENETLRLENQRLRLNKSNEDI